MAVADYNESFTNVSPAYFSKKNPLPPANTQNPSMPDSVYHTTKYQRLSIMSMAGRSQSYRRNRWSSDLVSTSCGFWKRPWFQSVHNLTATPPTWSNSICGGQNQRHLCLDKFLLLLLISRLMSWPSKFSSTGLVNMARTSLSQC